jgi:hypothetical protein
MRTSCLNGFLILEDESQVMTISENNNKRFELTVERFLNLL